MLETTMKEATMSDDRTHAAVRATAEQITMDDARAARMGVDSIPTDEVISEPNPSDYVAPPYLRQTAPELASTFAELLSDLRDLNARFAGERTLEVQAYLNLTGEHEDLEQQFLAWCQQYFAIRGSLNRLGPRNNDPWVLFQQCFQEYSKLIDHRIIQPGTINSSVLNLSQRFMTSRFPVSVLEQDLADNANNHRDRFGSARHRAEASRLYVEYNRRARRFEMFLSQVAQGLPAEYLPDESRDWLSRIRADVERTAEDLTVLRYALGGLSPCSAESQQIAPGMWARFSWDVYHGGSIGVVLTSDSPEPRDERETNHQIGVRRDGWLCHREYSWLRVHPEYKANQRRSEFAVNRFVLDTLTAPLYDAWLRLDPEPIIERGLQADATSEEQTAALTVVVAEPAPPEEGPSIKKRPAVPQLWLTRIKRILTEQFGCKWSMAKGSEQKVYRPGAKQFTFGCHAADRIVHPIQLRNCLAKLGIPLVAFVNACR
jgi:hypothetical protein